MILGGNLRFCAVVVFCFRVSSLEYQERENKTLGHYRKKNGDVVWSEPPQGSYHGNVKDAGTGVWLSTVNFAKAIVESGSQQFPYELVRNIIKDDYTQDEVDEYNKNINVSCGVGGGLVIGLILAGYSGYLLYYLYNRKREKYIGQKPLFSGKNLNVLMILVILTTLVQFIFVICIMAVNSKINTGINNLYQRVTNAMNDTTQYFQQTHKQYDFMVKDSNDWFTTKVLEEDFNHIGDLIWQPGHGSFLPTVSPIFQHLDDIDKYISNSKQLVSSLNHQIKDLTTGLGLIVKSNLTTAHTNLTLIRADWTCVGCDGTCTGCKNIVPDDIFPVADFFALPNLTYTAVNISDITRELFQGSSKSPRVYFLKGVASVIQAKLKDKVTDVLRRVNDFTTTVKMSTSPLRFPTDQDLYFDSLRSQFQDFHQRIEDGNDLRSGFTWFFTTVNILVIMVILGVVIFILSKLYKHHRTLMVAQEDQFILPRKVLLGCCIGCIVLCVSYLGLAIGEFYIGANLERVTCQTSKDYSIAQEVLDVRNTVPGHPGYFMASVVLGNGSLVLKLSEILRQCAENKPGFEALGQNQIIPDMKQRLDIQQKLSNIEDVFDSMYIDLVNTTLVPPELESWLSIYNTSTSIDQTPFLDLFNKTIIKADLDSYISNLMVVAGASESEGGPINPSKRRLLEISNYLTTIKPLVVQLANRKNDVEELYNNYQSNISVVMTKLTSVIDQLLDTNPLFWNQSSDLIRQGVDELRSDYKTILPEFTNISSYWMTNRIGMCLPLFEAYQSVVYGICDKVADFENAEWLLNGINGVIILVLSILILFIYKSLIIDTTHYDDINANFEKIFGNKKIPKEGAVKTLKKKLKVKKLYCMEKKRGSCVAPVLSIHDIEHNNEQDDIRK